jgi:hypothetical protein
MVLKFCRGGTTEEIIPASSPPRDLSGLGTRGQGV